MLLSISSQRWTLKGFPHSVYKAAMENEKLLTTPRREGVDIKKYVSARRKSKVSDESFKVLEYGEHEKLLSSNYRVSQLRAMCKHHGIKKSGNKNEINNRLFGFLKESAPALCIQRLWRGYVVRAFITCKGLRGKRMKDCTNDSDFMTLEEINSLSIEQMFIFTDNDGFTYGFDTLSLYNLLLKEGNQCRNPYNRKIIPKNIAKNLISSIRYGKLAGYQIDVKLQDNEEIMQSLSPQRRLEMRTIDLCQRIDELGNHTDVNWLLNMNGAALKVMLRELWDIWHYRANIPIEEKRRIVPPRGDAFLTTEISMLNSFSFQGQWRITLSILERFVSSGVDEDARKLGAMYVLTAITLVSPEAAAVLPWLYQSAAHF